MRLVQAVMILERTLESDGASIFEQFVNSIKFH